MEDDVKIIQIMPAGGWWAVYRDEKPIVSRLCAWGLRADGDVVALDVDCYGIVEDASKAQNYVGPIFAETEAAALALATPMMAKEWPL